MNNQSHIHSRRNVLKFTAGGLGLLALRSLLTEECRAGESDSQNPLAPKNPHHSAQAKRVIFLNMEGGPSAQETFKPKPGRSIFKFKQHGESGLPVSELLPHLATQADKLCMLHGMHSDSAEHISASIQLHCGKQLSSRPSMGSWVTYGLGSQNEDLPGFIILNPSTVGAGSKLYANAFLPGIYSGTAIGQSLELSDAANSRMDRAAQRALLERTQSRTALHIPNHQQDGQLTGLLNSYELGFRMQTSLPELLDVNREPHGIRDAYGIGKQPTDDFGRQCLAARRMSEAGVRFIELTHKSWDHHSEIARLLPDRCREIDQPIAALLNDLSQRGLLKDTLVLWGGEFGRTASAHHKGGGSGHNNKGYTMWMAGGGVRPGFSFGQTDEEGWEAIEGRIHTHDLHATMLHLLGLDHTKLTYRYSGRDFRLTDVQGLVVKEILS